MTYTTLRHLADSWGLVAMGAIYLLLCGWAFRPGSRHRNRNAATAILEDRDHG
jgi:cytochrome c oxidase cbb3-type subunit IV